ncbi:hypothetical protein [Streptomyces sp. NPDC056296]|uniref:hypothetical protein n=1 Tax=Streptomyces sp. NPDC056296 TaxID=3345775 RepID=UPI0035D77D6B
MTERTGTGNPDVHGIAISAAGHHSGWYDDDLLYAVVTRKPYVWERFPSLARELRAAVQSLVGLSRQVRNEVDAFLSLLPEES